MQLQNILILLNACNLISIYRMSVEVMRTITRTNASKGAISSLGYKASVIIPGASYDISPPSVPTVNPLIIMHAIYYNATSLGK